MDASSVVVKCSSPTEKVDFEEFPEQIHKLVSVEKNSENNSVPDEPAKTRVHFKKIGAEKHIHSKGIHQITRCVQHTVQRCNVSRERYL